MYGYFLRDIVNDDTESVRILEKADYVKKAQASNKQFADSDRVKYGENSNTCIITVSANYNNTGLITNINNEITRMLGY